MTPEHEYKLDKRVEKLRQILVFMKGEDFDRCWIPLKNGQFICSFCEQTFPAFSNGEDSQHIDECSIVYVLQLHVEHGIDNILACVELSNDSNPKGE